MLLGFYFDCYRGTVDAVPSLREVATFSSFFPIISMGPVERFKRLGAQLVSARTWNTARASEGLFLICLGLSKKLVIGDRLAGFVFDSPRHALKFDAIELWIFMFVSFVQIYCDFSGFVDIARGYSKLLGIEIVDNFDQPYLSRNVPEIWRRWHISLVDWLRDFVYNPISLRTQNLYLATAAVMFSVGMWHNISWGSIGWATYWSLLYGASILSRKRGFTLKLPNVVKIAFTIGLISFSTFFFLPTTLDELGRLTRNLLSLQHFSDGRIFSEVQLLREDVCIAAIACFFTVALETWQRRYYQKTETRSFYLLLCFAVLLFMTTVAFGVSESQAFLYLRF
jgi:D-alanyl-lipoteichoic acid acyltransferase DltB (MBOAT superfamily)